MYDFNFNKHVVIETVNRRDHDVIIRSIKHYGLYTLLICSSFSDGKEKIFNMDNIILIEDYRE